MYQLTKPYMKSIFLFCLTLSLISCSDDEKSNFCGGLFPEKHLPWLREAIEEYEKTDFIDLEVEQGKYNSQTVFILVPCCTTCDFIAPPVYTCDGQVVDGLSPGDEAIKERKVIWKTPADGTNCW
jgi:hypothetical protein